MYEVEELIDFNYRDRHFTECTTVGGVIAPLVKMRQYDLYLYGAASTASNCILFFEDIGIKVKGIIDSDEKKKGTCVSASDVPYIHISEIRNRVKKPDNAFVIIITSYYKGMGQVRILQTLIHEGFDKIYAINSFEMEQICGTGTEWYHCKRKYFLENIGQLQKTYDMLYDDVSKKIMIEFMRAHIQCSVYSLPNYPSSLKYFFEKDEKGNKMPLYIQLKDEVWVNCGANTGDTIFNYFENGLSAKRIYAFEGDKAEFGNLISGISFLPKEYRACVTPINLFISEDTGFENYIEDRITFINADIDCHEVNMLRSIKKYIKTDRPVLAICVYHKSEDLIEIPQFIDSLVSDYCYMLRKYDSNVFNASRTNELVLYAVPKERMIEY